MRKQYIKLSVPVKGSPTIVSGIHSKLYSVSDCSSLDLGQPPATVYQIEGTGAMLEITMFSGMLGSSSDLAVLEDCSEGYIAASDTKGGTVPHCVPGQYHQGARWHAKAGQLYTIVVYSYTDLSSKPFMFRLKAVEATPICGASILPIDLSTLNATYNSVQRLGGPEDSVMPSGLPSCDSKPLSSFVFYKITISQPNVAVLVHVQGGGSHASVYRGDCENGYSCLTSANVEYGLPPIYDNGDAENGTDGEVSIEDEIAVVDPQARQGNMPLPRIVYNLHSFHNAKAETSYLIVISSCCHTNVADFRLTVNSTNYGSICEDSAAIDLSSGSFSNAVDLSGAKVYRDLLM